MTKKDLAREKTEEQASVFKALADPTRLNLVKTLCHQHEPDALCVNALAQLHGISQSAISQHLRILKNIGLVKAERQGYHIHYRINHEALAHCHDMLATILKVDKKH